MYKQNVENVKKILDNNYTEKWFNNMYEEQVVCFSSKEAFKKIIDFYENKISGEQKQHKIYDDGTTCMYHLTEHIKIGDVNIYSNNFIDDVEGEWEAGIETTILNGDGDCMLYLREGFFCDYHGDLITDMYDYKIRKTLIKDEFDNNMIFNKKLFQIEADKLSFKLEDYAMLFRIITHIWIEQFVKYGTDIKEKSHASTEEK